MLNRLAIIAVLVSIPSLARADLAPYDVCEGTAAVGAACHNANATGPGMGEAGVCTQTTCSGKDYGHWDRDASAEPPTTTYACLRCQRSPGLDGGQADSGSGGKGGGGCSLASRARPLGAWVLALSFGAAVSLLRRRRR